MNKKNEDKEKLKKTISRKEARKISARGEKKGLWFGLGMFGLVGWSVVIPTLLGLAFGIWLDGRFENGVSWTLTMFFLGLFLGILNAWSWIQREGRVKTEKSEAGEENDN